MVELVVFGVLLVVGYTVGSSREKKHYQSLLKREKQYLDMPIRSEDYAKYDNVEVFLVSSSAVIAADYFKTIVVGFRSFIGGQIRSHETLMDRARREVMVRLKEQANSGGGKEIIGLRFEMNSIDKSAVEVMAYGTAIKPL